MCYWDIGAVDDVEHHKHQRHLDPYRLLFALERAAEVEAAFDADLALTGLVDAVFIAAGRRTGVERVDERVDDRPIAAALHKQNKNNIYISFTYRPLM